MTVDNETNAQPREEEMEQGKVKLEEKYGESDRELNGERKSKTNTEFIIREVLLGVTICFAQIPESVAFAFMANVKPPIALHAAWIVGLMCSAFGGRPGMVNGATGAFAAIIGTFIPEAGTGKNGPGVELLFPSVIFAGLLMFAVSASKLSRFITILPAPVMIGFCNGLAIVIGLAQLHPFKDHENGGWKTGPVMIWMLVICFTSMLIMEFLPKIPLKIFKVIPSSLVAIVCSIVIEFCIVRPTGVKTDVIGDVSEFTSDTAFPIPFFLSTDAVSYELSNIWSWSSFEKIIVQGFLLCAVGTIESLMTSEVVEAFVKTPSDGNRTVAAMGFGNILSGLLGGMGGNAMIGLSTVNCLNGGRGRLGPCVAALCIAACVMGAYPLLNYIPIAALAGIMIIVVVHTFKWFSLGMLLAAILPEGLRQKMGPKFQRKVPRVEVFVIFLVTILSNFPKGTNIAYAVGAGLAVCAINYSWNSSKTLEVQESYGEDGVKYYDVEGPLFFGASNRLFKMMKPETDPDKVDVRFSGTTSIMDYSAMEVLHKITAEYQAKGKTITFHSLCPNSQRLMVKANRLVKNVEYTSRDVEVQDIDETLPSPRHGSDMVG
eukprot:CAMPEP_0206545646 /NCGR_PEP_ID=MMETSP0325_2-20121206/12258_1 /ASSEMBLY_ACC=CAM_ASM_000347 /TAXON_ID=2866 /ORGANISM="Crypthecodinium cohnii, Strain Seligo" /LENGTH=601 /DNA_ID=CAMNT_0054044667 /DNA_START=36 /DNA_END=1841 /DNA_ORIENTATION=+